MKGAPPGSRALLSIPQPGPSAAGEGRTETPLPGPGLPTTTGLSWGSCLRLWFPVCRCITSLWQRAAGSVTWLAAAVITEVLPKVSLLYKCSYSLDHPGTSCSSYAAGTCKLYPQKAGTCRPAVFVGLFCLFLQLLNLHKPH